MCMAIKKESTHQLIHRNLTLYQREHRRYVAASIPADKAFEERAVTLIGNNLATTSPNIGEKVDELYEKARQAHKERIAKEMPGLAKILEAREEKEKNEV